MATHSSILVWEMPWTEEAGRPQSMGSQELDTTQPLNPQPSHPLSPVSISPSLHQAFITFYPEYDNFLTCLTTS